MCTQLLLGQPLPQTGASLPAITLSIPAYTIVGTSASVTLYIPASSPCLCQQASPQGIRLASITLCLPGVPYSLCHTEINNFSLEDPLPSPHNWTGLFIYTHTVGSAPNCRQGLRAHKAASSLPAPKSGINP